MTASSLSKVFKVQKVNRAQKHMRLAFAILFSYFLMYTDEHTKIKHPHGMN